MCALKANKGTFLETKNAKGRVWRTYQSSTRTRKLVSIHNDQAKSLLEKSQMAITKGIKVVEIASARSEKPIHQKQQHLHQYKESLRQHKKKRSQPKVPESSRIYGEYEGCHFKDLEPLIEKIMAWNDPTSKKQRDIAEQLSSGPRTGKMMEEEDIRKRIEWLLRPLHNQVVRKERREARLRLPPLVANRALIRRNTKEKKELVNLLFLNRSNSVL